MSSRVLLGLVKIVRTVISEVFPESLTLRAGLCIGIIVLIPQVSGLASGYLRDATDASSGKMFQGAGLFSFRPRTSLWGSFIQVLRDRLPFSWATIYPKHVSCGKSLRPWYPVVVFPSSDIIIVFLSRKWTSALGLIPIAFVFVSSTYAVGKLSKFFFASGWTSPAGRA